MWCVEQQVSLILHFLVHGKKMDLVNPTAHAFFWEDRNGPIFLTNLVGLLLGYDIFTSSADEGGKQEATVLF